MENHMKRNLKIWLVLVLAAVLIVAVLAAFWAAYTLNQPAQDFPFRHRQVPFTNPADIELFYIARTVVSMINVALLVVLVVTYTSIYMKTRSGFTIGLLIFALAFLLKDLTSNPFVTGAFGFQLFGLGPFALLPDLLELGAISVLLYLSIKY
jgi:hypothetical protein